VGTKDTHATGQHLQKLVGNQAIVHQTEIYDPYDAPYMYKAIDKKLRKLGWQQEKTLFDLSGGSKLMFYAATELAKHYESPVVDVERIGHRYRFRQFEFQDHQLSMIVDKYLPSQISIADYLDCHLSGFHEDGFSRDSRGQVDIGGRFEKTIYDALSPHLDEVMAGVRPSSVSDQIEIDLIVRQGNNVGIVEAKTGVKKAGIDQLDTAGNPHFMGDFLVKLLITGRYLPRAHKALANAQEIRVIELPGYDDRRGLPQKEEQQLVRTVLEVIEGH